MKNLIIGAIVIIISVVSFKTINVIIESEETNININNLEKYKKEIIIEGKNILLLDNVKILKIEDKNNKVHLLISINNIKSNLFYFKDSGLSIFSDIYETKKGKKILFKDELKDIENLLKKTTILTMGEGKTSYLLINLHCKNCNSFINKIDLTKNKLNIILIKGGIVYNRDIYIEQILNEKTNKKRIDLFKKILSLTEIKYDQDILKIENENIEEYINNTIELVNILNINEFPLILNENYEKTKKLN